MKYKGWKDIPLPDKTVASVAVCKGGPFDNWEFPVTYEVLKAHAKEPAGYILRSREPATGLEFSYRLVGQRPPFRFVFREADDIDA